MSEWSNVEAKKTGGKLPIPLNVLNKPPSAELAPDQKTRIVYRNIIF